MADHHPRVPFMETAEFKAAVSAQVEALIPQLLERLGAVRGEPGVSSEAHDPTFAKQLAYEIATYRGQENGRFYLDPGEAEKRRQAMTELTEMLIDLRAKADRFAAEHPHEFVNPYIPSYRLTSKTQLVISDEQGRAIPVLMDPIYRDEQTRQTRQTEIDHPGIPNLAMEPSNEAATRVMALFRTFIGEEAPIDPRTGVPIPSDADLGAVALSRTGTVVRGRAAAATLRSTKDSEPITHIRRGDADGGIKRRVQVLGSLTQPIEVR